VKVRLKSGTIINYLDQGDGAAVLLIHAFPLNHTMWQPQTAHLSSRFRVIAPDIRGFGESLPPTPWTIMQVCEDLREFLDVLDLENYAVVGISMGGYIALPFTFWFPDKVRQLVLADTRARADNDAEKQGRTEMMGKIVRDGIQILPNLMLPRLLRPDPSPQAVEFVTSIILENDPSAAMYALMAMRDRSDASIALERINCPTMVIAGEHDVVTRIEECKTMAEIVSEGIFVQIPKAGHLSNIDNPKAFNEALDDFLVVPSLTDSSA
jgi:pimeloyl-ACP methyl ester carboxylesterase